MVRAQSAHGGSVAHEAKAGHAATTSGRIVVGDGDPEVRRMVQRVTEQAGFACTVALTGDEAVEIALESAPDLIVLGLDMASSSGSDVLRTLRSDAATRTIPIIVITETPPPSATHLLSLADDYILKPMSAEELVARLHVVLRRARVTADINPLSGLPGNASLLTEVARRLETGSRFAYLYIDIDNFGAYNDAYGFAAGDGVIAATAAVIDDAVERIAPARAFIGHIGGDDFVVLGDPEAAEPLARAIVRGFDARLPSLYRSADLDRGCVQVRDRRGALRTHPLMSLSIGVVRTDSREFSSPVAVGDVANEMKDVARSRHEGSTWAVDRRRASALPAVEEQPTLAPDESLEGMVSA